MNLEKQDTVIMRGNRDGTEIISQKSGLNLVFDWPFEEKPQKRSFHACKNACMGVLL